MTFEMPILCVVFFPGFNWDSVNFALSSCCVLDLV